MSGHDHFVATFHEWIGLFMHRSMRGHIQFARKKGLSRSMLGALFLLDHKDNVRVTDLGEHLDVSSAAASQMLERLVVIIPAIAFLQLRIFSFHLCPAVISGLNSICFQISHSYS